MEGSAAAGDNGPFPSFPVASLLGFKGALRLIPHGSEQKPHLVLRRVDIIDDTDENAQTKRVARFSFFARKRIEVKPGKEIMFCVASGDDENAPFKDMPVVFEGDIIEACQPEVEKENEKPLAIDDVVRKVRNMEGLPPKMRKSITKAGAFNDFYFKESSSSFGFPGLPLHCATPRVYSSAAVQTEPVTHTPSPEGIQVDAPREATPLLSDQNIPIHLPSPVSADNSGGLDSDSPLLLAQGVSQTDVIERSLSPMELSSTSDTPRSSPSSPYQPLPDQPLLLANVASRASSTASSIYISPVQHLPTAPPQDINVLLDLNMVIDQLPRVTQELGSTPKDLPSQVMPASPDAAKYPGSHDQLAPPSKLAFLVPARDASIGIVGESQPPETASSKPRVNGIAPNVPTTKTSPSKEARFSDMQNAVASSSKVLLDGLMQVETPMLLSQSPHTNKEGKLESPSSTSTQQVAPLAPTSTFPSANTWRISPPPEPKTSPYIPAGTSANPLGIRPSSHLLPNQKIVPKGPRSLVGNSTTTPIPTGPKKPVVVGAKWSASMRNSSSTTSSSLSSIPSSSSLSAISAAPVPTRPTDLSKIISYGTPSPPPLPPPPSSEPPPPPPPIQPSQPETSKWKRIDGKALSIKGVPSALIELQSVPRSEKAKQQEPNSPLPLAIPPSTLKNAPSQSARPFSPTALADPASVKRTLSTASSSAGSTKGASKLLEEPPLKKSRTNDDSTPPPPSTTSKSQLSTPRAPSIQRTTVPQPLNHPLPPKPVAVGSSYRPSVKRERPASPEVPEPKRPATATDWPATICSMQHRLQGSSKDLSVQKIAFNGDGTQFALICADRTLRIWESKNPPAELARLSHNSPIVAVSWTWDDAGVITLGEDGLISMWARVGNEWKFSKVQMVPSPDTSKDRKDEMSLTCSRDRIAVAIPNFGVRVWINISGTWQQQREIVRSGVTAIRFVEGGDALVGGCRDGAVWYCEVPNGTLRAHAFTAKAIASLDVSPTGSHLLVGHEGGKALLVNFRPGDGTTERTYTSEKLQAQRGKFFAPVFATKGQAILHGVINSCALVWDRKKGAIVYGLKHPGDDPVTAAATFDGRPGVDGWMITGTRQGRLLWWPQPVAAAPSQSEDTQRKRQKVAS